MVAFEGIAALGELLLWTGAFILASFAAYLVSHFARPVTDLAGYIPGFGGNVAAWFARAEDALVSELDALRRASDAGLARALNALVDSLGIFLGLGALLGLGVKAAFEYLWHRLLKPIVKFVDSIPVRIATAGTALYAAVLHVARVAVHAFERDVVKPIERDVAKVSHDLYRTVAPEAAHALHDAKTALAAIAAAPGLAIGELHELPYLGIDDLRKLLDRLPWKTEAGLLAAIPLVHALVNVLAREAGLDRAACRSKVKGVCGTNPRAWADLLALATDFLLLTDMCAIIPPLEEGFQLVGGPLISLLTDVGAGLCGPGSQPPTPLHVPALHLSPASPIELHLAA